jgi:DNA-directed RNA polymerase subunit RPC12/RpoP
VETRAISGVLAFAGRRETDDKRPLAERPDVLVAPLPARPPSLAKAWKFLCRRPEIPVGPVPILETNEGGQVRATAGIVNACAILGHEMDNRTLAGDAAHPRCGRCHQHFLFEDGRLTHTRHVLGCFLRHHTYVRSGARDGHHEYTCVRCGHPLLFEAGRDPYAGAPLFHKKVRYRCGLFGHRVHAVGERHGLTEYACGCGHPFLLARRGMARVTHPLACTLSGHRVAFVERRHAYREHRCVDCGHTFGVAA